MTQDNTTTTDDVIHPMMKVKDMELSSTNTMSVQKMTSLMNVHVRVDFIPTHSPTSSKTILFPHDDDDSWKPTTTSSSSMEQRKNPIMTKTNHPDTTNGNPIQQQSNNTTTNAGKARLSFSTIEIRNYPMIVGDNPGNLNSSGVPLSIGWEYNIDHNTSWSIDDYEQQKRQEKKKKLYIHPIQRVHILLRNGCTMDDIQAATHTVNQVRQERNKSNNFIHSMIMTSSLSVKQAFRCTTKKFNFLQKRKEKMKIISGT